MHLYLHIPFCDSKCGYCGFSSFANQNHLKERYMQILKEDVEDSILGLMVEGVGGGGVKQISSF